MLVFKSSRAARHKLNLPTIDIQGDARFGYDGGRNGQTLVALAESGTEPRERLLIESLLLKHSLHIRVVVDGRLLGLLQPIHLRGGGMIRGFSLSGVLYTLLPSRYDTAMRATLPLACNTVDER